MKLYTELTGALMAAESDGTLSAFNRGQARGFATELTKSHGELLDLVVALLPPVSFDETWDAVTVVLNRDVAEDMVAAIANAKGDT